MSEEIQTTQPMSLQRALLTRMFEGDLELAAQFARIRHSRAAREHINAALTKLNQLDALGDEPAPAEKPAIDV